MPQKLPLGNSLFAVCLMRIRKGKEYFLPFVALVHTDTALQGMQYTIIEARLDSKLARTGTMPGWLSENNTVS